MWRRAVWPNKTSTPPSTQVQTRRACRARSIASLKFSTDRQHSAGRARPPDGLRPTVPGERLCLASPGSRPINKPAMAGINSACVRDLTSRSRRNPPSSFGLVALRDEDEREGKLTHRPEIGRGYPLNLSISLSGGKETNQDSLSNGE